MVLINIIKWLKSWCLKNGELDTQYDEYEIFKYEYTIFLNEYLDKIRNDRLSDTEYHNLLHFYMTSNTDLFDIPDEDICKYITMGYCMYNLIIPKRNKEKQN